jgi:pyruvate dehydrogenase E1 component alpha subunit
LEEKKVKIPNKFDELSKGKKIDMLKKMYQIRHFEEEVEKFIMKGMIYGTCHLYSGEEACAVGAVSAINEDDFITSTHRGHGHCVAKGADLNIMMAELLGRKSGYCKGKGGSMHIADLDMNNLGANGIVGGSLGIASGAALTCKMKKNGKMVLSFFGDGASNQGVFHESINIASVWKLPLIYYCENNQFGMTTPLKDAINIERISDRKASYGIQGITIDGNDIVEVYNTVSHFAGECKKGNGPVLIEGLTYRWKGHSKHDWQPYRTKEEVEEWKKKEPIARYIKYLMDEKVIKKQEAREVENAVLNEIKEAVIYAENDPDPDLSEVDKDVYAA